MQEPDHVAYINTKLGWMAVVIACDGRVRKLVFGYRSVCECYEVVDEPRRRLGCNPDKAARVALHKKGCPKKFHRKRAGGLTLAETLPTAVLAPCFRLIANVGYDSAKSEEIDWILMQRLSAYTWGIPDSFSDVPTALGPISSFQRRVLEQCREIPYGQTTTYSALASSIGFPHAARAVGNCLAANPIPIIIPCHRVICSDGTLGGYSAPGGTAMKRRLLGLEAGKLA